MKITNPTVQPKGDSKMSAIAKLNEMFPSKIMKIGDVDVETISARAIHARVESQQKFSHWIKARIEKYGFIEEQDYVTSDTVTSAKIITGDYPEKPVTSDGAPTTKENYNLCDTGEESTGNSGQFTAIEYEITLDMAKELGMVEGNAKGREVRQYFIAAEKEMRRLQAENFTLLENKTKLLEKKVAAFDTKTFEIRDRNSYLEKKRALFIDDHIIKEVTQAYEEATRELRETQDLMYSREWAEGTTKPLAKCLQKLIMARMRNILRVTKNLRKFFKGSELETEYLLNRYIDEIEVEAKHLQW